MHPQMGVTLPQILVATRAARNTEAYLISYGKEGRLGRNYALGCGCRVPCDMTAVRRAKAA